MRDMDDTAVFVDTDAIVTVIYPGCQPVYTHSM